MIGLKVDLSVAMTVFLQRMTLMATSKAPLHAASLYFYLNAKLTDSGIAVAAAAEMRVVLLDIDVDGQ